MPGYPLHQCALYKVTSPQRLAAVLSTPALAVSVEELEELAARTDNFSIREIEKPSGGKRRIEEPKPRLQALHGRIHTLLAGVTLPDYVHSVRKGRSYITNAREHVGQGPMVKVDIERFFPSVRRAAVAAFFRHTLKCEPDVAALLGKLLTIDGHLATGSKASPILSFFAHYDMFEEIAAYVHGRGLRMTLYVDDIAISGHGANNTVISAVRRIIAKHGLRSHKMKQFSGNRPKVVTGIVVTRDGIRLPNRRHRAIRDGFTALHEASGIETKLDVLADLGSRVHEAAQVDSNFRPRATHLDRLRRNLKRSNPPSKVGR